LTIHIDFSYRKKNCWAKIFINFKPSLPKKSFLSQEAEVWTAGEFGIIIYFLQLSIAICWTRVETNRLPNCFIDSGQTLRGGGQTALIIPSYPQKVVINVPHF